MKVSIITVSYNAARTIEQTIHSVLKQTYADIEYVIVDGQSTDATIDIIKKYERDINCFVSEPDSGIYDAMNKGVRYATGDIIGFVNGDDWYEPDAVEKAVKCFCNTDAEIIHGMVWIVDEDGRQIRKTNGFEKEEVGYEQLYYRMLPHLSVFAKKAVFEQYGGFDTHYRIAADYDWVLRCYASGVRFQYINSVMGCFRRGGISTSMVNVNELAEENRDISLKYAIQCGKNETVLNQIDKKYKAAKFHYLAETSPVKIVEAMKKFFPNIGKGVIIFGAGIWGEEIYRILCSGNLPVHIFVDNNKNKWGKELYGITVTSPEILETCSECGYVIIAVSNYYGEICSQLSQMGNTRIQWIKLDEIWDIVI